MPDNAYLALLFVNIIVTILLFYILTFAPEICVCVYSFAICVFRMHTIVFRGFYYFILKRFEINLTLRYCAIVDLIINYSFIIHAFVNLQYVKMVQPRKLIYKK